jgi:predicted amidohydrolase YtcJ
MLTLAPHRDADGRTATGIIQRRASVLRFTLGQKTGEIILRYTFGFCLAVMLLASQPDRAASNLVWVNGHIYTANPKAPWAEGIAINGARIEAVGSSSAVRKAAAKGAVVVDLKGKTVIPGIIDGHAHTLYGSFALHGLNLSTPERALTPEKKDEFLAALKRYAADHPNDKVLFARADFSTVPPTTPSHELLDQAVGDRPLIIHNVSEHAFWINAAAIKLAGLNDYPVSDPIEEKGVIRDASGHPTGVLLEAAMQIAARAIDPLLTQEDKLAMLRDGTHYLNSFGITSVVNATGSLAEIRLYAALRDRGELTVRTRTSFGDVAVPHQMTPEFLKQIEEARQQYHDEWVSANLVKFFADGSTGLIPPLVYEPHAYQQMIIDLDKRGFQIMTHAIREDSVHMVLDAYQALEQRNGPRDRRLRIEHLDLLRREDEPRFAQLQVTASMQPSFCCSSDGLNLDPSNTLPLDRWNSLLKAGTRLIFSSDWPCTWPPSPFVAMEEAVRRDAWRSPDTDNIPGEALDGGAQSGARKTGNVVNPEERITVTQAVDAYTRESAFAEFADSWAGTLEPGKVADLVVLSQDIFSVPSDKLSQTRVLETLVGGKSVYRAD